eukprot:6882386-Heterocapsa_arctica.AAC.1
MGRRWRRHGPGDSRVGGKVHAGASGRACCIGSSVLTGLGWIHHRLGQGLRPEPEGAAVRGWGG